MLTGRSGQAPARVCIGPSLSPHVSATWLHCLTLLILTSLVSKVSPDSAGSAREIDLVSSLHLHNTTFSGLLQKPGPHSANPAALFTGSSRSVYYSAGVRDSLVSLVRSSSEFTFLTSVRQMRHNSGSLISLRHSDSRQMLEIQSSGRQDVLRLLYMTGAGLRVETFPLRLADDSWHRLAVIVSGDQIEVLLDCRSVHTRVVTRPDTSFQPDQGELTAWLGQRNQDNFLFKGYLQDPRLVSGHHGYLLQCPGHGSSCPTCGQFRDLQETVTQLQRLVTELSVRLSTAEARVTELETCECSKSCLVPGDEIRVRKHHDTWRRGCDTCTCDGGLTSCAPLTCPPTDCAAPDPPGEGECCPKCGDSCSPVPKLYPSLTHGEVYTVATCHVCSCHDGFVNCTQTDVTRDCPQLTCPEEQRVTEEGTCCPVCREQDYCGLGHDCHHQAQCKNGIFSFSCHCQSGFQGNGTHCEDVDECSTRGGPSGHHCTLEHGTCLNLPGGYTCGCESGFRMDSTNTTCLPVNTCQSGLHTCHSNATCLSTGPGTFKCSCNNQFSGDGHHCEPVCDQPCDNGGKCVAPDTCVCSPGYQGSSCQEDINECDLGIEAHQCGEDSVCVNRVGWFYCSCLAGYRSYHNPLTRVTTCLDEDECETGTHTCHSSATCLNTLGGYTCFCADKAHSACSTDCVLDGQTFTDGSTWRDGCNTCQCDAGRATCAQVTCDCRVSGEDRGCCPQCSDPLTCAHQAIPGLRYSAGQRWVYNCQECECLHGEVDCWPLDCPPQPCARPRLTSDGSCCPQCPGAGNIGGCVTGNSSQILTSTWCVAQGQVRREGDTWHVAEARTGQGTQCSSCECKGGRVYCSLAPACALDQPLESTAATTTTTTAIKSQFFLEQVTIPKSNHDTVTPVVSDSDPRDNIHDRIRDTGQHNKPRHKFRVKSQRKSQKTFEFSNELLDRYVRPKKSNGENFSESEGGLLDQV